MTEQDMTGQSMGQAADVFEGAEIISAQPNEEGGVCAMTGALADKLGVDQERINYVMGSSPLEADNEGPATPTPGVSGPSGMA